MTLENRWPDYALFPANGSDFVRYVGTMIEDMGYGVSAVAPGSGIDLVAVEPASGRRMAVQAQFFNGDVVGNGPVQQMLAGMAQWGLGEGWLITNATGFSEGAWRTAQASGVRLVAGSELNDLAAQVASLRALGGAAGAAAAPAAGAQAVATGPAVGATAAVPGASGLGGAGVPAVAAASTPLGAASTGLPGAPGGGAGADPSATQLMAPVAGHELPGAPPATYPAPDAASSYPAQDPSSAASAYAPQTSLAPTYGAPDVTGALTPVSAAYAPAPARTFGPTEVMMRWNCTDDYLREQMRYGLPLFPQADGSYAITEQDLLGWEYMMAMAAAQEEPEGGGCLIGAVASIAFLVVAIVAIIVFYPYIAEAIEGAFPGVHVLTWEEILEKLPWSQ